VIIREFGIIDEADEVARGVLHCFVSGPRDVLRGLACIRDGKCGNYRERGHSLSRRLVGIIIHCAHGNCELAVRRLTLEHFQKVAEQMGPLERADADGNMIHSTLTCQSDRRVNGDTGEP